MTSVVRAQLAALVLLFGSQALAQEEKQPETPALSPEEQAEIEKALQGDAAAEKPKTAPAAEAQAAPSPVAAAIQSLNPDLSFIADFAVAGFSQEDNLQAGGHDPTQNGFNFQALELTVGSAVDPYFRFDANLVFSQEGVEIEEAYATTLGLPAGLQVRVGQFLTRFGRQNATHPHQWDFADQPFALSRMLGGEGNRGLGVEGSYLLPTPWYAELVGSMTDARGEETARSFFLPDDVAISSPLDFVFTGALKQFFDLSDDLSLLVGLSGANGPNGTGESSRSALYGADVYLKFRPLREGAFTVISLQSEWFYRRRQIPGDVLADVAGYVQGFWRFRPEWGAALRYEFGSPATLRDGQRAGDLDYLDPDWVQARHRASAALTFWPTEFSRARLQLSADYPLYRAEPIYAGFLTMEFAIGAHGAHKF